MNILITGGAGFIGKNLAVDLIKRGHSVSILDNFSKTGKSNFYNFLQKEKCYFDHFTKIWFEDIIENNIDSFWFCVLKNIDVVFHLAASTSVSESWNNPEKFEKNNVMGTIRILEQARKNGVKKVVFISSGAVYGKPPEDFSGWKETDELKPISPYGITKKTGEDYCLAYQPLGIDCIIARLSNVYGPEQLYSKGYTSVIPSFINACFEEKNPIIHGDGQQRRDFVFVKDVTYALISLVEKGAFGTFNIGNENSLSINKVLEIIQKYTSYRIKLPNVEKSRKGDVALNYLKIDKLKSIIGAFPKYSLEEGLDCTFLSYKERLI